MSFIINEDTKIHTDRLLLRKFYKSDTDNMLKNWIADPEVQSGYGEPILISKPDVESLLKTWEKQYRWAIILKSTNENIGHVSFCRLYDDVNVAEIEYCIGKGFWGKGITAEALCSFIRHTFQNTSIIKIEAFHRVENSSSGHVLQKAGLYLVDNVMRYGNLPKAPDGSICYAITRKQFIKKFT